jgi:flagellar biosynthetic protein FliR
MFDLTTPGVDEFWVFLQVLARFSSLVAIAPVFGARQIPPQVKVGLTLVLSVALTPLVASSFPHAGIPGNMYDMISTLVLQAAVGLIMGFVASLVLSAFQIGGSLLDLQVGFTMAQTFNPNENETAAPLNQFQYYYALLLFLLANGHHLVITALARSFAMLPASALDLTTGHHLQMISDITFGALVNGAKIAVPTCAVLFILDVAFALMSRAMPQLNIFFVGMPAKVIVGLLVIGVLLPATAIFAGELMSGQPQILSDLLHSMHRAASST